MTRSDPQDPETRSRPERTHGEPRQTRSIRFSASEWTLIEQAAARQGLSAPEIVRASARALAEEKPSEQSPAALSPGHVALIEATWRAVHLLASLATRHMRYEDIDDFVGAAHNAMIETMNKGPDRTHPGEAPSAGRRQRNDKAGRVRGVVPGPSPLSGGGRNGNDRITSTLYHI